jgi:hypothetical protein
MRGQRINIWRWYFASITTRLSIAQVIRDDENHVRAEWRAFGVGNAAGQSPTTHHQSSNIVHAGRS